MNPAPANMSIWAGDKLVCIKIAGRASFSSSVDFKTVVNSLWQSGSSRFVIDLSDCPLMDSTFLGVLAGFGVKFSATPPPPVPARIELLNPNARIADLLENLGVAHLFNVHRDGPPPIEQLTAVPQPSSNPSKEEVSRVCLEAHQTLMDINPANVPKFKDVTRFLAEDLKKQR